MPTATQTAVTPLIHCFHTDQGFYVYDANTNRIITVEEHVYRVLAHYTTDRTEDEVIQAVRAKYPDIPGTKLKAGYDAVQSARHRGLFSKNRPRDVRPFRLDEDTKDTYSTGLRQLILELTEQCNLRCRYCTYSDYYPLTRGYSGRTLRPEVAKKAISYFLEHSKKVQERVSVTFYGGEPLLQMDLLQDCCEYARDQVGERARFQLTTNGTLLTPDNVRRLSDIDMNILVSIDGPQEVHDANRVTTHGNPTFAKIAARLERIRDTRPEFYEKNVGFVCVISSTTSPLRAWEFFESRPELFDKGILVVNLVSGQDSDYWERNPPTPEWRKEFDTLRLEYYRRLIKSEPRSKFLDALFQKPFLSLWRREPQRHLPAHMPLHGCCVPGARRLFVDCDGRFHMCERVNRTIPIGTVDTGLDMDAVEALWEKYSATARKECLGCWAFQYCPRCFVTVSDGDFPIDSSACNLTRQTVSKDMEDYCRIAEINPFAFEFMRDIKVS